MNKVMMMTEGMEHYLEVEDDVGRQLSSGHRAISAMRGRGTFTAQDIQEDEISRGQVFRVLEWAKVEGVVENIGKNGTGANKYEWVG